MRTVTLPSESKGVSLWDKSLWQHRECNGKILTSVQGRVPMYIGKCRLIRLVTDETDKLLYQFCSLKVSTKLSIPRVIEEQSFDRLRMLNFVTTFGGQSWQQNSAYENENLKYAKTVRKVGFCFVLKKE